MTDTAATGPAPGLPHLPRDRDCPYDPPPAYARLRETEPISRIAFPAGGWGWLATRYRDVRAVLADPRFSSRLSTAAPHVRPNAVPLPEQPLPGSLLRLDGAEHARYRRPVIRAFTHRRIRELRPRIRQIVDERLDAMARCAGPVDLVAELALPVPSLVICELLGVPYRERAEFQDLTGRLLAVAASPEQSRAARAALGAFMAELVAAKRTQPGEDLLSTLVAEADADPGSPLTDLAITVLGTLLLIAGHETTANMIALGALTLLRNPGQAAALRADPAIADRAVEELLRYLTVIQFGLVRTAEQDVVLGGCRIRAGDRVVVALPSADRDPDIGIADPDRLDITREPTAHLAFGHGAHQCLGQQLARAELQITLSSLFTRFPGLRAAVPDEEIPFRDDTIVYGVHRLPVTW